MKQITVNLIDKVARRAGKSLALHKKRGDSFDVLEVAFLKAAYESAEFYETNLLTCPAFHDDLALLSHALELAPKNGSILEFGVASGRTISHLAKSRPQSEVYGFDSFEGLPEDWRSGFEKGAFAGKFPPVPNNVKLVQGWFEETIAPFLEGNKETVALLHVDCDLYSSTKTILDHLSPRLVTGSVIVFDEYWNYPGWMHHEYKAFEELKSTTRMNFEPIGFVPSHQQVGFVLRG